MVIYILAYSYAFISAFLLILAIQLSKKASGDLKKLLVIWFVFGFIFNFYSFSWYYTVYPLVWLPPGVLQLVGIFVAHLILSLVAAIPYLVGSIIFLEEARELPRFVRPLFFGATLAFAEVFRSIFISTLFKGEGTDISFHYISGALGNALSMTPLVEFAYWGGTYALSFLFGILIYIIVEWRTFRIYVPYLFILTGLYSFLHFFVPTFGPNHPTTIGVVTTSFPDVPDSELNASFKTRLPLLLSIANGFSSSTSVIVYPEDTRLISHLNKAELMLLHKRFPNTLFLDGDTLTLNNKLTNVSVFSSPDTETISLRSKSFLLPFNEYMPYFFSYLLPFFLPSSDMKGYEEKHTYIPVQSGNVYQFRDLRISTLLCSEVISYEILEKIKQENPSLVFFQSRLQVFHDNPWFWMHLYMFSKTAAAELRRPIIGSADGAPSVIVSPHGDIVRILPTGIATTSIEYPF